MAVQTTTERLEAVEAAIAEAETSEEYKTMSLQVKRSKLEPLYKERRTLKATLAMENGSNPAVSIFDFTNVGRG